MTKKSKDNRKELEIKTVKKYLASNSSFQQNRWKYSKTFYSEKTICHDLIEKGSLNL